MHSFLDNNSISHLLSRDIADQKVNLMLKVDQNATISRKGKLVHFTLLKYLYINQNRNFKTLLEIQLSLSELRIDSWRFKSLNLGDSRVLWQKISCVERTHTLKD